MGVLGTRSRIVLIALVSLSLLAGNTAMAQYTLPDQSNAAQYATHLISDYNALVGSNDSGRPDFQSIKGNFSLYENTGSSFEVVVMQTRPNCTDDIAMVFFPIHASQPQVRLDASQTLADFAYGLNICGVDQLYYKNVLFINATETTDLDFIWVVNASEITVNPVSAANSAAQVIYNQDQAAIGNATQTEASTSFSGSTQTTTQSSSASATTSTSSSANTVANTSGGVTSLILLGAGVVIVIVVLAVALRWNGSRREGAGTNLRP